MGEQSGHAGRPNDSTRDSIRKAAEQRIARVCGTIAVAVGLVALALPVGDMIFHISGTGESNLGTWIVFFFGAVPLWYLFGGQPRELFPLALILYYGFLLYVLYRLGSGFGHLVARYGLRRDHP
jgi:hypothetical protein